MSWLFARTYDRLMAETERACLAGWRTELLREVGGRMLEIGAGTGRNLEHYSETVEHLVLLEPDRHMRARLAEVVPTTSLAATVEVNDGGAEALPFADESFDAVVSTLVLCSVPDQRTALDEIVRVLRPGGSLLFLEHVAATHRPRRLRWQHRLEPVWKRLAGGCHLTRATAEAIAGAGLEIGEPVRESARKAMPLVRTMVRGVATKPA
ncbi:class I SAM-dependent methyltransferase [soil metagenome]